MDRESLHQQLLQWTEQMMKFWCKNRCFASAGNAFLEPRNARKRPPRSLKNIGPPRSSIYMTRRALSLSINTPSRVNLPTSVDHQVDTRSTFGPKIRLNFALHLKPEYLISVRRCLSYILARVSHLQQSCGQRKSAPTTFVMYRKMMKFCRKNRCFA